MSDLPSSAVALGAAALDLLEDLSCYTNGPVGHQPVWTTTQEERMAGAVLSAATVEIECPREHQDESDARRAKHANLVWTTNEVGSRMLTPCDLCHGSGILFILRSTPEGDQKP